MPAREHDASAPPFWRQPLYAETGDGPIRAELAPKIE
jgi:hypothetical protein